jgi:hypothetical protein
LTQAFPFRFRTQRGVFGRPDLEGKMAGAVFRNIRHSSTSLWSLNPSWVIVNRDEKSAFLGR